MKPLRIKSGLNISKEEVLGNVRDNMFAAPWLDRQLGEGSVCLVGGGPSIESNLDKIRNLKAKGASVWALNNAHDYLISKKIAPDYAVMIDGRPENAEFYRNPLPNITYLISSQCHPSVFAALKGFNVLVWHPALGGEVSQMIKDAAKDQGKEWHLEIGGGCTVGLRSMYLAYACGFRDMHLFGYDSSHKGYHHAYKQELNDKSDVIEVEVAGEKFKASPSMAKQAFQFQAAAITLTKSGAEITVHGDGLLPAIHREMHRPIASDDIEALEARKYSNIWAFDQYRKYSPGEKYVDLACAEMGIAENDSLIDFGCGTGRPAQAFANKGIDVIAIDHAQNCLDDDIDVPLIIANLWKLPEIKAKYGFCTDVMEHIPPDRIHDVLGCISDSVSACFFAIHTGEDAMGELIDEPLHLTIEEPDWWEEVLSRHFSKVHAIGNDGAALFVAYV